jgi:tyrosine-protein kinase
MADNEVNRVARANLEAAAAISDAAEAGRDQIEGIVVDEDSFENGDAGSGRVLRELALANLETIRAACESIEVASRRAAESAVADLADRSGTPVESAQRSLSAPQSSGGGRPPSPPPTPAEAGGVRPLIQAISSHRRIVAVTMIAALLGAIAFLAVRQTTYQATANVLVQPVPQDDPTYLSLGVIRDSGDPIRTTQTAATLLDTTEAASRTAQQLGGDWTTKSVEDGVDVAPVSESNIIAITGTADTGAESAKLADTFAQTSLTLRNDQLEKQVDQAIDQTQSQLDSLDAGDPNAAELANELQLLTSIKQSGDPSLELQQNATVPDAPTNPSPILVVMLALIAGLVLGSGAALLRELFGRRIADADEATAIYPMSVLARVPLLPAKSFESPEGTAWYIPPEIFESFLTLAIQLEQRDRSPSSLMVTSPTRGDGKTTSAINLAVTLARVGRSVILLDFDLRNPQVAESLGMQDVTTTASQLADEHRDFESLLVHTELPNLRILPIRPGTHGGPTSGIDAAVLQRLIRLARANADWVVVDTPPLGEVSDALTLSREIEDILVVMRPGNTGRSHLKTLGDLLERTGHRPEGCILIDSSERVGGGYHSSGYGMRKLPGATIGRTPSQSAPDSVQLEEVRDRRK